MELLLLSYVNLGNVEPPNNAVLVTAARLRFWMNLKSLVWAAARDRGR